MHKKHIIVVGRGHSGTRIIPQVLVKNGVFMGSPLSKTGEYWGPTGKNKKSPHWHAFISAGMSFGAYSKLVNKRMFDYDFSDAAKIDVPKSYRRAIAQFYQPIVESDNEVIA